MGVSIEWAEADDAAVGVGAANGKAAAEVVTTCESSETIETSIDACPNYE